MAKIVSVIYVTDGKRKDFIYNSLFSVFNQTYKSYELIIVKKEGVNINDSLLPHLSHLNKIKIVNSPNDFNIPKCRNLGIKNSKGSYITYIDDDDFWESSYLESQVREIENVNGDIIHCQHFLRRLAFNNINNNYEVFFGCIPYNVPIFDRELLVIEPYIHISTVLHSRDVTNVLKFSEEFDVYSEWDFLLRASKMFRFFSNSSRLCTIQTFMDRNSLLSSYHNSTYRFYKKVYDKYLNQNLNVGESKVILDDVKRTYNSYCDYAIDALNQLILNSDVEYCYQYFKHIFNEGVYDDRILSIGITIAENMNDLVLKKDFEYICNWTLAQEDNNYIPNRIIREGNTWKLLA